MMQFVLRYTHRYRPIVSLPFALGMAQGAVLERLPPNILTISRDQVSFPPPRTRVTRRSKAVQVRQLKSDNVVSTSPAANHMSFKDFVERHSHGPLKSVHEVLPTYLG
jgi:hypothetical protein